MWSWTRQYTVVGGVADGASISGNFLDTLLVLEPSDHVEAHAANISGNTLRFPGEWLKKVE